MPSDYGIIICDISRKDSAGSVGRGLMGGIKNWQRHRMGVEGDIVDVSSVKSSIACDGNYTVSNLTGNLYVEAPRGVVKNHTRTVLDYVNALYTGPRWPEKKIYIHACAQGREPVWGWWKAARQFNTGNVRCPCTTAMLDGSVDNADVKRKLGLSP